MTFFAQETEKLDSWADVSKVDPEREITELDRKIKEARAKSKGDATLAKKLLVQKSNATLKQIEIANVENCIRDKTKSDPEPQFD